MFSQCSRGKKSVLTIGRLAYLRAQGNKASETYAEWRERPSKRSAGHCEPDLGSGKIRHGRNISPLTLWKCTGFCIESVHMVKYTHPPRDHEELTGMDRRPRGFRKVCMANAKTRL